MGLSVWQPHVCIFLRQTLIMPPPRGEDIAGSDIAKGPEDGPKLLNFPIFFHSSVHVQSLNTSVPHQSEL